MRNDIFPNFQSRLTITLYDLDEVVLRDGDSIDIDNAVLVPTLVVGNLRVIAGHLALLHQAALVKRPVLQTTGSIST